MKYFLLLFSLLAATNTAAADKPVIRIGVQASGTLGWELSVLERNNKAGELDFTIETRSLANPEAGKIALQSGAVDMIVSDWIWVSRLRADGADFTFYPYSTNSGVLMVPEHSKVYKLADLKGKKLGIAGGELDKNWLLLQALAKQQNLDLKASVEQVFGAPPLIDEQLKLGRIDAALNYWHYAAKLEGQGFRKVIDGKDIMAQLGVAVQVPTLGYVFSRHWAEANPKALSAFITASTQAKTEICTSDQVWRDVLPLTHADDKPTQDKLRHYYCDGAVKHWDVTVQQTAEKIYGLLRGVSDNKLTGQSEHIQPGTFWIAK